uniref:Putative secreted protein n=1 Tax=Anopheles darlingi TaxID=43151 RepID=A0A2M4DKT7_ANODA
MERASQLFLLWVLLGRNCVVTSCCCCCCLRNFRSESHKKTAAMLIARPTLNFSFRLATSVDSVCWLFWMLGPFGMPEPEQRVLQLLLLIQSCPFCSSYAMPKIIRFIPSPNPT